MLSKYNELELENWRSQLMNEIRKKIELDWNFPTSYFVLTEVDNQLKILIIQPKENYSYDELLNLGNSYVNNNCIALLLVTQTSLPFVPKNPTLFSHFKIKSSINEKIQAYQLYPKFKFFSEVDFSKTY